MLVRQISIFLLFTASSLAAQPPGPNHQHTEVVTVGHDRAKPVAESTTSTSQTQLHFSARFETYKHDALSALMSDYLTAGASESGEKVESWWRGQESQPYFRADLYADRLTVVVDKTRAPAAFQEQVKDLTEVLQQLITIHANRRVTDQYTLDVAILNRLSDNSNGQFGAALQQAIQILEASRLDYIRKQEESGG